LPNPALFDQQFRIRQSPFSFVNANISCGRLPLGQAAAHHVRLDAIFFLAAVRRLPAAVGSRLAVSTRFVPPAASSFLRQRHTNVPRLRHR